MIETAQLNLWQEAVEKAKRVTVLTGAGISAESGIPTFRGKEGYWTVGSKEYHPQEMATHSMFLRQPLEVWKWYCYRRSVCSNVDPNPGHMALVELEKKLGDQFCLITQNVDGLHLRAGNTTARTFQIHGNIQFMRCSAECTTELYPVPDFIPVTPVRREFPTELLRKLRCPKCDSPARPHVLWFDEVYDEKFYRFESSLQIAAETDLLLVVGTSGATTLPNHIVRLVVQKGGMVFDINLDANPFGELAVSYGGVALIGPSGELLPELISALQN